MGLLPVDSTTVHNSADIASIVVLKNLLFVAITFTFIQKKTMHILDKGYSATIEVLVADLKVDCFD